MSLTLYSNLNCSGHCTWWKTCQLSVIVHKSYSKGQNSNHPVEEEKLGNSHAIIEELSHQQEKLKVHCNLSKFKPHKAAGISWTPSPPQREDNKVNIRINEQTNHIEPKASTVEKRYKIRTWVLSWPAWFEDENQRQWFSYLCLEKNVKLIYHFQNIV